MKHIGYMKTLERGRVALWLQNPANNGHGYDFFVGSDDMPVDTHGHPMGLRLAPSGAFIALNGLGLIKDHETAQQIEWEAL